MIRKPCNSPNECHLAFIILERVTSHERLYVWKSFSFPPQPPVFRSKWRQKYSIKAARSLGNENLPFFVEITFWPNESRVTFADDDLIQESHCWRVEGARKAHGHALALHVHPRGALDSASFKLTWDSEGALPRQAIQDALGLNQHQYLKTIARPLLDLRRSTLSWL